MQRSARSHAIRYRPVTSHRKLTTSRCKTPAPAPKTPVKIITAIIIIIAVITIQFNLMAARHISRHDWKPRQLPNSIFQFGLVQFSQPIFSSKFKNCDISSSLDSFPFFLPNFGFQSVDWIESLELQFSNSITNSLRLLVWFPLHIFGCHSPVKENSNCQFRSFNFKMPDWSKCTIFIVPSSLHL